jgi:hypothetical protein
MRSPEQEIHTHTHTHAHTRERRTKLFIDMNDVVAVVVDPMDHY